MTKSKILKAISIFFVAVMMTIAFAAMNREIYYSQSQPRAPVSATGNVYPVDIRGTTVYLNRDDFLIQTWLFKGSFIFLVAGIVLWRVAEKK